MKRSSLIDKDIRCSDELTYEDGHINACWECWFDVEKYFGIILSDSEWINFYTNWYPDGKLEVLVFVDKVECCTEVNYKPTRDEKKFLLNKMNTYCKETCGMSLKEFYEFEKKEWG